MRDDDRQDGSPFIGAPSVAGSPSSVAPLPVSIPGTEPDLHADPDASAALHEDTDESLLWNNGGAPDVSSEFNDLETPEPSWLQRRRRRLLEVSRVATSTEVANKLVSAMAIIGVTVFVVWQLRPDLLFSASMDGGKWWGRALVSH